MQPQSCMSCPHLVPIMAVTGGMQQAHCQLRRGLEISCGPPHPIDVETEGPESRNLAQGPGPGLFWGLYSTSACWCRPPYSSLSCESRRFKETRRTLTRLLADRWQVLDEWEGCESYDPMCQASGCRAPSSWTGAEGLCPARLLLSKKNSGRRDGREWESPELPSGKGQVSRPLHGPLAGLAPGLGGDGKKRGVRVQRDGWIPSILASMPQLLQQTAMEKQPEQEHKSQSWQEREEKERPQHGRAALGTSGAGGGQGMPQRQVTAKWTGGRKRGADRCYCCHLQRGSEASVSWGHRQWWD
jgi:hypothetical protein